MEDKVQRTQCGCQLNIRVTSDGNCMKRQYWVQCVSHDNLHSALGPLSESWFDELTKEHEKEIELAAGKRAGWSPCPVGGTLNLSADGCPLQLFQNGSPALWPTLFPDSPQLVSTPAGNQWSDVTATSEDGRFSFFQEKDDDTLGQRDRDKLLALSLDSADNDISWTSSMATPPNTAVSELPVEEERQKGPARALFSPDKSATDSDLCDTVLDVTVEQEDASVSLFAADSTIRGTPGKSPANKSPACRLAKRSPGCQCWRKGGKMSSSFACVCGHGTQPVMEVHCLDKKNSAENLSHVEIPDEEEVERQAEHEAENKDADTYGCEVDATESQEFIPGSPLSASLPLVQRTRSDSGISGSSPQSRPNRSLSTRHLRLGVRQSRSFTSTPVKRSKLYSLVDMRKRVMESEAASQMRQLHSPPPFASPVRELHSPVSSHSLSLKHLQSPSPVSASKKKHCRSSPSSSTPVRRRTCASTERNKDLKLTVDFQETEFGLLSPVRECPPNLPAAKDVSGQTPLNDEKGGSDGVYDESGNDKVMLLEGSSAFHNKEESADSVEINKDLTSANPHGASSGKTVGSNQASIRAVLRRRRSLEDGRKSINVKDGEKSADPKRGQKSLKDIHASVSGNDVQTAVNSKSEKKAKRCLAGKPPSKKDQRPTTVDSALADFFCSPDTAQKRRRHPPCSNKRRQSDSGVNLSTPTPHSTRQQRSDSGFNPSSASVPSTLLSGGESRAKLVKMNGAEMQSIDELQSKNASAVNSHAGSLQQSSAAHRDNSKEAACLETHKVTSPVFGATADVLSEDGSNSKNGAFENCAFNDKSDSGQENCEKNSDTRVKSNSSEGSTAENKRSRNRRVISDDQASSDGVKKKSDDEPKIPASAIHRTASSDSSFLVLTGTNSPSLSSPSSTNYTPPSILKSAERQRQTPCSVKRVRFAEELPRSGRKHGRKRHRGSVNEEGFSPKREKHLPVAGSERSSGKKRESGHNIVQIHNGDMGKNDGLSPVSVAQVSWLPQTENQQIVSPQAEHSAVTESMNPSGPTVPATHSSGGHSKAEWVENQKMAAQKFREESSQDIVNENKVKNNSETEQKQNVSVDTVKSKAESVSASNVSLPLRDAKGVLDDAGQTMTLSADVDSGAEYGLQERQTTEEKKTVLPCVGKSPPGNVNKSVQSKVRLGLKKPRSFMYPSSSQILDTCPEKVYAFPAVTVGVPTLQPPVEAPSGNSGEKSLLPPDTETSESILVQEAHASFDHDNRRSSSEPHDPSHTVSPAVESLGQAVTKGMPKDLVIPAVTLVSEQIEDPVLEDPDWSEFEDCMMDTFDDQQMSKTVGNACVDKPVETALVLPHPDSNSLGQQREENGCETAEGAPSMERLTTSDSELLRETKPSERPSITSEVAAESASVLGRHLSEAKSGQQSFGPSSSRPAKIVEMVDVAVNELLSGVDFSQDHSFETRMLSDVTEAKDKSMAACSHATALPSVSVAQTAKVVQVTGDDVTVSRPDAVGFTTGNGKALRTSAESRQKAAKMWESAEKDQTVPVCSKEIDLSKEDSVSLLKLFSHMMPSTQLNGGRNGAKLHDKEPVDTCAGFTTAAGKSVALSSKAKEKAAQMWQAVQKEVSGNGISMEKTPLELTDPQPSTSTDFSTMNSGGFSTAGGKAVPLSSKAKQKAAEIWRAVENDFQGSSLNSLFSKAGLQLSSAVDGDRHSTEAGLSTVNVALDDRRADLSLKGKSNALDDCDTDFPSKGKSVTQTSKAGHKAADFWKAVEKELQDGTVTLEQDAKENLCLSSFSGNQTSSFLDLPFRGSKAWAPVHPTNKQTSATASDSNVPKGFRPFKPPRVTKKPDDSNKPVKKLGTHEMAKSANNSGEGERSVEVVPEKDTFSTKNSAYAVRNSTAAANYSVASCSSTNTAGADNVKSNGNPGSSVVSDTDIVTIAEVLHSAHMTIGEKDTQSLKLHAVQNKTMPSQKEVAATSNSVDMTCTEASANLNNVKTGTKRKHSDDFSDEDETWYEQAMDLATGYSGKTEVSNPSDVPLVSKSPAVAYSPAVEMPVSWKEKADTTASKSLISGTQDEAAAQAFELPVLKTGSPKVGATDTSVYQAVDGEVSLKNTIPAQIEDEEMTDAVLSELCHDMHEFTQSDKADCKAEVIPLCGSIASDVNSNNVKTSSFHLTGKATFGTQKHAAVMEDISFDSMRCEEHLSDEEKEISSDHADDISKSIQPQKVATDDKLNSVIISVRQSAGDTDCSFVEQVTSTSFIEKDSMCDTSWEEAYEHEIDASNLELGAEDMSHLERGLDVSHMEVAGGVVWKETTGIAETEHVLVSSAKNKRESGYVSSSSVAASNTNCDAVYRGEGLTFTGREKRTNATVDVSCSSPKVSSGGSRSFSEATTLALTTNGMDGVSGLSEENNGHSASCDVRVSTEDIENIHTELSAESENAKEGDINSDDSFEKAVRMADSNFAGNSDDAGTNNASPVDSLADMSWTDITSSLNPTQWEDGVAMKVEPCSVPANRSDGFQLSDQVAETESHGKTSENITDTNRARNVTVTSQTCHYKASEHAALTAQRQSSHDKTTENVTTADETSGRNSSENPCKNAAVKQTVRQDMDNLKDKPLPLRFGFQTAAGKAVSVSEESLQKVWEMFDAEMEEETVSHISPVTYPDSVRECSRIEVSSIDGKDHQDPAAEAKKNIASEKDTDTELSSDKSVPFFGFQTASGTKVTVSELSLKQARKILDSTAECTKPESPKSPVCFKVPDIALNQKGQHSDLRAEWLSAEFGFQTAGGRKVTVSEQALSHARSVLHSAENMSVHKNSAENTTFEKDFVENLTVGKDTVQNVTVPSEQNNAKSSADGEPPGVCISERSFGFQTAAGNRVTVSERALLHVRSVHGLIPLDPLNSGSMENSPCAEEDAKASPDERADVPDMCEKENHSFGFKTSGSKSVLLSDEALPQTSNILTTSEKEKKDNPLQVTSFGFQTAGGKTVFVSEKALLHARDSLRTVDEENISKESDVPVQSFAFQTAGGKTVSVSQKALSHARRSLMAAEKENIVAENGQPAKAFGFQTAGGKAVTVSEKALAHARGILSTVEETCSSDRNNSHDRNEGENAQETCPSTKSFGFQTAGGRAVTDPENAMSYTRNALRSAETLDSSVRLSHRAPSTQLSGECSGADVAKIEQRCLGEQKAPDLASASFLGFQTAGGKSVAVSEKALSHAKNVLSTADATEQSKKCALGENTSPAEPLVPVQSSGFQTAGGKAVSVSNKALSHARKFLMASDDFKDKKGQDLGVEDELVSHPQGKSFGFQTAGGKEVSVSDTALKQAKTLFGSDATEDSNMKEAADTEKAETEVDSSRIFEGSGRIPEPSNIPEQSNFGFHTAGGAEVSVSKKALVHAQQMFQNVQNDSEHASVVPEPSNIPEQPKFGFQTAGGTKVSVSNKALAHARQLFQNDQNDSEHTCLKLSSDPAAGLNEEAASCRNMKVGVMLSASGGTEDAVTSTSCFPVQAGQGERIQPSAVGDESEAAGSSVHRMGNPVVAPKVPEQRTAMKRTPEGTFSDRSSKRIKLYPSLASSREISTGKDNGTLMTPPSTITPASTPRGPSFQPPFKKPKFTTPSLSKQTTAAQRKTEVSSTKQTYKICDKNTVIKSSREMQIVSHESSQSQSATSLDHVTGNDQLDAERQSSSEGGQSKCLKQRNLNEQFDNCAPHASSHRSEVLKQVLGEENEPNCKENREEKAASSTTKLSSVPALSGTEDSFALEEARMCQDKIIRQKKHQRVRPVKGKWLTQKSSQQQRKFGDLNVSTKWRSQKELLNAGVSVSVVSISSQNAEDFRFHLHAFHPGVTGGTLVGDGALLVPDDHGFAGKEEFHRAFLTIQGVDPALVSPAWLYNHFRWIVWKLAAYEVTLPHLFASRALTPEVVLYQLKYRYDREVDACHRSALKKIVERDDTPCKRLVLCVADIKTAETGERVLELTDGWYSIPCQPGPALQDLIDRKKLAVGQKIVTSGAELAGSQDSCSPLEMPPGLHLKISANSTRPALPFAKLGFQRCPTPLCVPLSTLSPQGGQVGCVDIAVVRKYPLVFMEKQAEGRCIFRTADMEEKVRRIYEEQKQSRVEKLCSQIQREMEKEETAKVKRLRRCLSEQEVKKLTTGAEISEAMDSTPYPEELQGMLSGSQMEQLMQYRQQQQDHRQQQLNQRLQQALQDTSSQEERVVIPMQKLRITGCCRRDIDAKSSIILTVWRPGCDWESVLEGRQYRIYGLTASAARSQSSSHEVQLTAGRQTRLRPLSIDENLLDLVYEPREIRTVRDMRRRQVPYSEIDFVGVVVTVKTALRGSDAVYMIDSNGDLLLIWFWGGVQAFSLQDVLKEGAAVAANNLRLKSAAKEPAEASACLEMSQFSSSGRSSEQRQILDNLRTKNVRGALVQQGKEKLAKAGSSSKSLSASVSHEVFEDLPPSFLDKLLAPLSQVSDDSFSEPSPSHNNSLNISINSSLNTSVTSTTQPSPSAEEIKKKRAIQQQKIARLQSYGHAPALSPLPCAMSPASAKAFKPPTPRLKRSGKENPMN